MINEFLGVQILSGQKKAYVRAGKEGRVSECKGKLTNYFEISNFEMSKRQNATSQNANSQFANTQNVNVQKITLTLSLKFTSSSKNIKS